MISIQCCKQFKKVESIWRLLWKDGNATIYQSPEYIKMVCKYFFPYKFILRKTPCFIVFYEDETPIMILPLFKSWFKKSYILFGYKAGCGYLDAVYSKSMTLKKMEKCFEVLYRAKGIRDIQVYHVKEDSLLGQYILQTQKVIQESVCTTIALPESFDEYNASLSKNSRQNIRTAYNRLEKQEKKHELEIYDASKTPKKLRSSLLRLYADRQVLHYKKAGGFLYRLFIRFIDIGTKLQTKYEGRSRVFVLKIDGKVAAYFDAIYTDYSIVIPRLAIQEEFNWFSPGIILLNESIKVLCAEKEIRVIDLTHGAERYKLAMGGAVAKCIQANLQIKGKE